MRAILSQTCYGPMGGATLISVGLIDPTEIDRSLFSFGSTQQVDKLVLFQQTLGFINTIAYILHNLLP